MSASACVPATAFGGRPFWLTHESLQSTLHSSMATKVPPRSLRRTGSLSLRPHRRRARAARSNARRRQEGRWMHFSQQTLKCRTVHCTACTGRNFGRRSGWGASAACLGRAFRVSARTVRVSSVGITATVKLSVATGGCCCTAGFRIPKLAAHALTDRIERRGRSKRNKTR